MKPLYDDFFGDIFLEMEDNNISYHVDKGYWYPQSKSFDKKDINKKTFLSTLNYDLKKASEYVRRNKGECVRCYKISFWSVSHPQFLKCYSMALNRLRLLNLSYVEDKYPSGLISSLRILDPDNKLVP